MRDAAAVAWFVFAAVGHAHARPPATRTPSHAPAPVPRVEPRPAAPLPMLPSVARVRVEAARDRVVVVEEVNLPRGDWQAGGLDLYVSFGAPGVPVAIDARLVPVPQDSLESRPEDSGDALALEQAVRRTPSTQLLLGRPQMAGVIVRVKESDLRRGYAASDLAALRIRSLLSPPVADPHGVRDVVVRLGIVGDLPLTLSRVQVVSLEGRQWITRADAMLCGPEADEWPLAVTLLPKAADSLEAQRAANGASGMAPIAPAMAVRHSSDDLCVRWWAEP